MKKSWWLFYTILIISTLMTMSANNWIGMWIGLEFNMMSFIPLILSKINKSSSEAAMIYFLTQSISSMMLLMMILINMYKYLISSELIQNLINTSILIKLGAAPFHMWMPKIMSNMEWSKCGVLMTWQKIAPMTMISNLNNSMIINICIVMSITIGSLGGLNQSSLRKMMGYSSINHLGWMLAINKSMNMWIMYLLVYSFMILMICYLFFNYKLYFMNQLNSMNMNPLEKISFFIMMLSMGGLPPFIGFLPKWITIQSMINNKEFFMIMFMIMFSLITLMYYLRVMTSMFLSYNSSIKWSMNYQNKFIIIFMLTMNLMLPMIMIFDIL